ncbi:MAG: hypothetical protein R3Y26_12055, partial [Rikenellaceae bacterium]
MTIDYYKTRLSKLNNELTKIKSTTSRLYLVRLIVFLIFTTFLILSFTGTYTTLHAISATLFLVLFIAVVFY